MTNVMGLDHVSILVSDAEASLVFYQTLLGLPKLERPDLGFPGYWLGLGGHQTLHLMELPESIRSSASIEHGGRDFHFALRVASIEEVTEGLTQNGVAFTQSRSGRKALFFRDPDNNAIELFEPS